MAESPLPDARATREVRGPTFDADVGDLGPRIMRIALVPASIVALLGALAACLLVAQVAVWLVIAVALVGSAGALLDGARRAKATTERIHQRLADAEQDVRRSISELRALTARGPDDIDQLVTRIRNGERPDPGEPPGEPSNHADEWAGLAYELKRAQHAAAVALIQSSYPTDHGEHDRRLTVFVNLGRRLQSLTHRAIKSVDELYYYIEDPDLLNCAFTVDHLVTGTKRNAESLIVLGGGATGRKQRNPELIKTVLRSAVSEVEQYARVKVVQPSDGTIRGHAVADIIHLLAELLENATKFSPPKYHVHLRTESVTAGLAIEIQDRGLGWQKDPSQLHRMNELLATPGKTNIGELLKDGRIGLYVVAELARRHGVAVRLQTNIYGGTDAVVVLPHELLDDEPQQPNQRQPVQPDPAPRVTAHAGDLASPPHSGHAPRSIPASGTQPNSHPNAADEPRTAHGSPQLASPVQTRQTGRVSLAPEAAGTWTAPADRALGTSGVKPPLPQRTGTHMPPELQQPPVGNTPPAASHRPGLMTAFQQGINRGAENRTRPESSS